MQAGPIYANSIIVCRENRLLNVDRVRRMFAAPLFADALKILYECGYSESIISEGSGSIDLLINDELTKTVKTFTSMCSDDKLTRIFLNRYDAHNLKAIFKSKYSGVACEDAVYPFGEYGYDKLSEIVRTEKYAGLPDYLVEPAKKIVKRFEAGQGLAKDIDIEIDKATYNYTLSLSKKIRDVNIRGYFTAEVDIINLTVAARAKILGFSPVIAMEQFIGGGLIEIDRLNRVITQDVNDIPKILAATDYFKLAKPLCVALQKGELGDFTDAAQAFLFAIAAKNKNNVFTLSPLFYWLIKKQTELKVVKLILICKQQNIPAESVRSKLGSFYE